MDPPNDWGLTPDQVAEIGRRLADDEPDATEEDVRAFFGQPRG